MANNLLSNGISTFDINHFQMFMLLFADDTVLFADTLEELQILMDILHEYSCKWNISVNITKTKSMGFKSGNRREDLNLHKCCNMNMSKDKYHFLLIYPAFSKMRRKHFPYTFAGGSLNKKFITLKNNQQAKFFKNLAAYIKRKSLLGYQL